MEKTIYVNRPASRTWNRLGVNEAAVRWDTDAEALLSNERFTAVSGENAPLRIEAADGGAAYGRRVAAGHPAAYLRLRVRRQPSLLLRQRVGHGAQALARRDGPYRLRHAQKYQPAAAAHRSGGAQYRRAGIPHAAAQQIDLAKGPLVPRRIPDGHHTAHKFSVDPLHGIISPVFFVQYSISVNHKSCFFRIVG